MKKQWYETQEMRNRISHIKSLKGVAYTTAVVELITQLIEDQEDSLVNLALIAAPHDESQIRHVETTHDGHLKKITIAIWNNGLEVPIIIQEAPNSSKKFKIIEGVHRFTAVSDLFANEKCKSFDPANGTKIRAITLPHDFFDTDGQRMLVQASFNGPEVKLPCTATEAEKALNQGFVDGLFGDQAVRDETRKKAMNTWLRKNYPLAETKLKEISQRIIDNNSQIVYQVRNYRGKGVEGAAHFAYNMANRHLTLDDADAVVRICSGDGANWERNLGTFIGELAKSDDDWDKVARWGVHFPVRNGESAVDDALETFMSERWEPTQKLLVVKIPDGVTQAEAVEKLHAGGYRARTLNDDLLRLPQKMVQDKEAMDNGRLIPVDDPSFIVDDEDE